jgi:hypothetical protein
VAFNDIFRLRVHCRLHGGEVINVLHFVDEAGVLVNPAQVLADDFRTSMDVTLRARASLDMAFEYVEVTRIVPYGDGPQLSLWPSSTNGTVGSGCASGTLAEVVTLYTGRVGRRYRGRIFFGGIIGTGVSAGLVVASQSTRTQNHITALLNRYGGLSPTRSWGLGVWSRAIAGPDPPWSTDAFTRVTSATVRTIVRNQRRRQVGVGR